MTKVQSTAQATGAAWDGGLVSSRRALELVRVSYELSGISFEEYAKRAVDFAKSKSEQDRRALTQRRINLLKDKWGPWLKSAFENTTTMEMADAVLGSQRDNLDLSRNPFKRIATDLAITYKSPPKRTTDPPADGEKYAALLEGTGFDLFWQRVEQILMATNEVVVWPSVVTRRIPNLDGSVTEEMELKHRYAAGNRVSILTSADDPTEPECYIFLDEYRDEAGTQFTDYHIWTHTWFGVFREDGNDLVQVNKVDIGPESAASFANPYGRLQFVLIRRTDDQESIWDVTSGEDLVDLAKSVGIKRQFYNYQFKMSGFKSLFATGNIDDAQPQQVLDVSRLGKIAGDSITLHHLDWQLDHKAAFDVLLGEELVAAASYGINPESYKRSATYQTAFGAQIAERGLKEHRQRFKGIFGPAEREYYQSVIRVTEAHGMPDIPSADADLEVVHAPMDFPESPKDQMELDTQRIAIGLESPVSIMMRENPELTGEEALERITKNMESTALVNDMKASRKIPNDPTNISADAEEFGAQGPAVRDAQQPETPAIPPGSPPGQQVGDRE